jgi:hypothetical protein
MKSVIDILEELEAIGSRLAKEEILEQNSKNQLLKQTFLAALDPYIVYYVNKFTLPRALDSSDAFFEDDVAIGKFINGLLPQLSARELTGNLAKSTVSGFFAKLTKPQQKWCQRILLKNIRCGVQTSTFNKIWPGDLKGFSVQLAKVLKTHHEKAVGVVIDDPVKYAVRVEPKLDGLRLIAVKRNGVVTLFTRNGTVLDSLPKIKSALEDARMIDNVVFDGEALGKDWNESASILMSRKNQKDDTNIVYHVFDIVSFDDWQSQQNNEPLVQRIDKLISTLRELPRGVQSFIKRVEGDFVTTEEELIKFYEKSLNEGHEGIMVKNVDSPYVFKRSDGVLKMKPVTTYEGVIVGSYDGRVGTSRADLFGGFNVLLPNGVITRVGGGFNDSVRSDIQLLGVDSFIGRVAEIEAQPDPSTSDGLTRDGKARFPVFTRFRDKNDVDPKVIEAWDVYKNKVDESH